MKRKSMRLRPIEYTHRGRGEAKSQRVACVAGQSPRSGGLCKHSTKGSASLRCGSKPGYPLAVGLSILGRWGAVCLV